MHSKRSSASLHSDNCGRQQPPDFFAKFFRIVFSAYIDISGNVCYNEFVSYPENGKVTSYKGEKL